MPTNKFTVPSTLTVWLKQLGIAALYILFGFVIHYNFTSQGIVSAVWPGSGLALAVLLIGGRRYLWGVFLGALLTNAVIIDSFVWVIAATLASILEVLLGVWLLTRNNKFSSSLNTLSNFLRLIAFGGGVASIIGAIIGALALLLAGFIIPADYFRNVLHWWIGDTLGVVLVTPFILAWWQAKSELLTGKQLLEVVLLVGTTFIAGQIVFLGWFNESLLVVPKAFVMFLFITCVAIRLGIRSTTFALNMIAIQALSGAYLKVGYFANETVMTGLHNYGFFILILSVVGMTLTTYVNEFKQKELSLRESENHLRLSQINGGIGTWEADLIANKQKWSENCVSLLGFPSLTEPRWEDFLAAVHPEDRQKVIDARQSHNERGTKYEVEYRIVANGDTRWMRSAGQLERNADGKITLVRGIVQDITERKQTEETLRESEELLRESQIIAGLGSYVLDIPGGLWKSSEMLDRLFGIDKTYERSVEGWLALISPDDRTMMDDYFRNEVLGQGKDFNMEYRIKRLNDQAERWVHGLGKLEFDAQGRPLKMHGTIQDISVSKAAADEIERLAFYDPLTGLPNRRLLWDRLKLALASSHRSARKGALLFIDMDNFKVLNDTLGHDKGDLLLKQVAQRLESCMREGDTVARLGGDEFVVMLEDLSEHALDAAAQTEMIGNKILTALNQPYQLAMHECHSTPSIGATLFNSHEQSIDELLKQADIAMYQAKSSGRNTLRFFDPQMQASISARVALEADLRLALAENQFKLYYQPQVCHNRQVIGAEVLIRWQHPLRGLVSPEYFIPLAEETGLILHIGQWVLETACAQIKIWEGSVHNRHLQLAVNVSARQFRQVNFVEEVTHALQRNAINPDRLKLELTESLVLDDIHDSVRKMNALREVGVHFSMDDFGTGYSSLAYLTQLPLDQLKIDRSFIHNIGLKTTDAVIVQTIIGMANNLGMEVIAEGVETEAQRIFLEQHGCQVCQGYLFSQPIPIEQFESIQKH